MAVSVGDVLKTVMEVELADGSIAQNVYYHKCAGVGSIGDITAVGLLNDWIEDAYNELSADLSATITQRLCTVDELQWDAGEEEWMVTRNIGSFTPSTVFNNSGDVLPNQSSGVAVFNTTRPKSRGRKFLFPFGEDRQNATYLIGAALTDLADYAAIVLNNVVYDPFLWLEPGVPRSGVNTWLPFMVAIVTSVLGTQRRRRPGTGE